MSFADRPKTKDQHRPCDGGRIINHHVIASAARQPSSFINPRVRPHTEPRPLGTPRLPGPFTRREAHSQANAGRQIETTTVQMVCLSTPDPRSGLRVPA